MSRRVTLPLSEQEALRDWRMAVDALKILGPDSMVGKLDWPARKNFLRQYVEKRGVSDPAKIHAIDMIWDLIHPEKGIGINRYRQQMKFQGFDGQAAVNLVDRPPEGTRARLRGNLLRRVGNRGISYYADWTRVKIKNEFDAVLNDPYGKTAKYLELGLNSEDNEEPLDGVAV